MTRDAQIRAGRRDTENSPQRHGGHGGDPPFEDEDYLAQRRRDAESGMDSIMPLSTPPRLDASEFGFRPEAGWGLGGSEQRFVRNKANLRRDILSGKCWKERKI